MDVLIRSRSREILLTGGTGMERDTENSKDFQSHVFTSKKQVLTAVHSCRANPPNDAEEVDQFSQASAGRGGRNSNPVQLG
jgi:hypothetical protein